MDDLVIKSAGGQNATTGAQTNATATGTAQTTTATAATQSPKNTRAFNLEQDEKYQTTAIQPIKYAIPASVMQKYPELVELIKITESMDDQEREYWFNMLPVMSPEQVEKLRNILTLEKEQLQSLDQEYSQALDQLNQKHQLEWKEFESKEKQKALKSAENAHEAEEAAMEADLLAKLSDL